MEKIPDKREQAKELTLFIEEWMYERELNKLDVQTSSVMTPNQGATAKKGIFRRVA